MPIAAPDGSSMECHRPYEPVSISTADCEQIEYLGRCSVECAEGYALDTLRPSFGSQWLKFYSADPTGCMSMITSRATAHKCISTMTHMVTAIVVA